ncbi:MAG: arsenate reductase ArsC [Candidatus Odyssella sp.]|nr:arsenate reductase ArsC [Candidatus Odyssella sp.]
MPGPHSVLFACTLNAVRSPMAEAILKHLRGKTIYVDSVGLKPSETDGFAIAVMDELGFDIGKHKPKTFDQLEDSSFDLIVTLSPEAHHKALEWSRHMATEVEYWPTFDATIVEGDRERRLEAYREVRDQLMKRIRERFPAGPKAE